MAPRRNLSGAFLVLALLMLCGTPASAGGEWPFRKGASIHNMMNWAAVEPQNPSRYAWPPFAGAAYQVSDGLLRNLAQAGFDFIRLTVDPGPFLQFTGERREALDRHLVAAVQRLWSNGFAVIIDFHPNSQVAAYAPERLSESPDSPLFLDYARMVRRAAGVLARRHSDRVALELMNEPQYGWDPATTRRWQRMLEFLHGEARAEAPDLLLVLTGARGGDAKGLIAVDPRPFAQSRVLYGFHYYEPFDFTHQGVRSTVPSAMHWRFASGLPYPPQPASAEEVWQRIRANILAASDLGGADKGPMLVKVRTRVIDYLTSGFGGARIAADFEAVRRWALQNAIDPRTILLGEFGATRTYGIYHAADPASYQAWLSDVRLEAESRGFAWAVWAVSGYGGMALVRTNGADGLDPVSLRGLGLADPQ